VRGAVLASFGTEGAVGAGFPAKSVYAAASEATLAVREVTLAVSVALSCARVVCSVVAAAARLSRYPSRRANVSGGIGSSSPPMAAFAAPT